MGLQRLVRIAFPPLCLSCGAIVEDEGGLCATCWRAMPFITGLTCETCGVPLPGESDRAERCDDCLVIARPWQTGVAAFLYKDTGRRMILSLKHGDRVELARPAAKWLCARLPRMDRETLILPVPVHWKRRISRRYNQAALIALALGREKGLEVAPLALRRPKATPIQDGLSRDERFRNLQGAITVAPDWRARIKDRPVLIVDDVMTSGATLAAAADTAVGAGATRVDMAVVARVAKDV